MRRLAHYDYWEDKVRRSILLDAKADILVYGMGEKQVLEIARRLKGPGAAGSLDGIRGTVVARKDMGDLKDCVTIPSFEEVCASADKFNEAFRMICDEADPFRGRAIAQSNQGRFVICYPPAKPLEAEELDNIYSLNYTRGWHPSYEKAGGVPGFETVRFSVVSNRGCCGECSFCSLHLHQGRIVQSRSEASILKEIEALARRSDFTGTITDIGGPTANLYGAECRLWKQEGACRHKRCLTPHKCHDLKLGNSRMAELLSRAKSTNKVNHVFIGSGVRYDLVVDKGSEGFLEMLCRDHVSGLLKVAPEHTCDRVLALMNKPSFKAYEEFAARFAETNRRLGREQYLANYFISAHPGSTLEDALEMALYFEAHGIHPDQIQDFIPLPMTLSGCIFYTGRDPVSGKKVYVAKSPRERGMHRALMQYWQPGNRGLVLGALRRLKKFHFAQTLLKYRGRYRGRSRR